MGTPEAFLETFGFILHQTKGRSPFVLWPRQRQWLRESTGHDIILKPRGVGSSTTILGRDLHASLVEGGDILIAADCSDHAANLVEIAKFFLINLPWPVPIIKDNECELEIGPPYSFSITAISRPLSQRLSTAGRSERCRRLICTEMGFWPWPDEYWPSVMGALVPGGTVAVESTASFVGSKFHKLWTAAQNGEGALHPFEYDWRDNPEYTDEWAAQKLDDLGPTGFAREYTKDFAQAGNTYFTLENLWVEKVERTWACGEAIPGCLFFTGENGELTWLRDLCTARDLRLYELPEEGRFYQAFADSATGQGKDFSCCMVGDFERAREVAHLHGKWKPDVFARMIDALARLYPGDYCPERNHPGPAVIQELERLETPGLWMNPKDHHPGWLTSGETRPFMVAMLEKATRKREFTLRTEQVIEEMRWFLQGENGVPAAAAGFNDDRVITAAGLVTLRQQPKPGIG